MAELEPVALEATAEVSPRETGGRLKPDQLVKLDAWIESNGTQLTRPAAIRLILEKAP